MKNILILAAAICVAVSCSKSENNEKPNSQISVDYVSEVGLTSATVSATMSGFTSSELSRIPFGILYVTEDNLDGNADDVFQSFVDNGNTSATTVYGVSVGSTGNFSVSITGLDESETVYCCAFLVKTDNSRIISETFHFKTASAESLIQTSQSQESRFFDATVNGVVALPEADRKNCSFGIVWSDRSNTTVSDGTKIEGSWLNVDPEGNFEVKISRLGGGKTYYYRTYVCVNSSKRYFYGTEKSFSTKDCDELAVDLGLSVKWASCDLGANTPEETGTLYAWGCDYIAGASDNRLDLSKYPYYSSTADTIAYIGENISGTQYDIVCTLMGGNWRMPTKEEAEELYLSTKAEILYNSDGTLKGHRMHANGNYIDIKDGCWTGTRSLVITSEYSKYGINAEAYLLGIPVVQDSSVSCLRSLPRWFVLYIRPVCDY